MPSKGFDARLAALEKVEASAAEGVRADIRYPADVVRRINRGAMELGAFDLAREIAAAETIAASAKGGKDPFAGRMGDFERHYLLDAAGEIMPYRIYVPKNYNARRSRCRWSSRCMAWAATKTAGWIVTWQAAGAGREVRLHRVVALGYRVDGFYG